VVRLISLFFSGLVTKFKMRIKKTKKKILNSISIKFQFTFYKKKTTCLFVIFCYFFFLKMNVTAPFLSKTHPLSIYLATRVGDDVTARIYSFVDAWSLLDIGVRNAIPNETNVTNLRDCMRHDNEKWVDIFHEKRFRNDSFAFLTALSLGKEHFIDKYARQLNKHAKNAHEFIQQNLPICSLACIPSLSSCILEASDVCQQFPETSHKWIRACCSAIPQGGKSERYSSDRLIKLLQDEFAADLSPHDDNHREQQCISDEWWSVSDSSQALKQVMYGIECCARAGLSVHSVQSIVSILNILPSFHSQSTRDLAFLSRFVLDGLFAQLATTRTPTSRDSKTLCFILKLWNVCISDYADASNHDFDQLVLAVCTHAVQQDIPEIIDALLRANLCVPDEIHCNIIKSRGVGVVASKTILLIEKQFAIVHVERHQSPDNHDDGEQIAAYFKTQVKRYGDTQELFAAFKTTMLSREVDVSAAEDQLQHIATTFFSKTTPREKILDEVFMFGLSTAFCRSDLPGMRRLIECQDRFQVNSKSVAFSLQSFLERGCYDECVFAFVNNVIGKEKTTLAMEFLFCAGRVHPDWTCHCVAFHQCARRHMGEPLCSPHHEFFVKKSR